MDDKNGIYININNFDITKLKIKRDKKIDGTPLDTYSITYEDKIFYITPNKSFDTYGIQLGNKDIALSSISSESDFTDISVDNKRYNFKKISIIFDDNNRYHLVYKNVINNIYKRLCDSFRDIKIHNPINNYNAMNIEINDKTFMYEYNKFHQKLDKLVINDVIKYRNFPFKIAPTIFFKKFNKKNNILYFNLCIKYAIIEYKEIVDFDTASLLFDDINSDIQNVPNLDINNNIYDDVDEINF